MMKLAFLVLGSALCYFHKQYGSTYGYGLAVCGVFLFGLYAFEGV